MKRQEFKNSSRRGGLFFEIAVAALLVGVGAFLWYAWRRAGFPRPSGAHSEPRGAAWDATDEGARLQRRVRDLLAEHGVKEAHVVKSYTRERNEQDVRWLEDTLELKTPPGLRREAFLDDLNSVLGKVEMSIVRNDRNGEKWVLELGAGRRVFQRLIFR